MALAVVSSACATIPTTSAPSGPTVITWEEKLEWMLRLEDQRILRDPNPPPAVVLVPATAVQPAIVAPLPPTDLIRLLGDEEPRVRRRAALALGRVGLPDGVDPLVVCLKDPEAEVRQMAAFALGLIGEASARPALVAALADPSANVQGRAAEALGSIGDRMDAAAIARMVQAHASSLAGVGPDDLTYPQPPAVEAARLGLYALARLGAYEAIAATVLDAGGRPVSMWWPVAYALQRSGDARATPALVALLNTPGRYTAAFAARGLGALKAQSAAAPLVQIVEQRQVDRAVLIQAVRALGGIGGAAAVTALRKLVMDPAADGRLRIEAMNAFGAVARADDTDFLLDLTSDRAPGIRAAAMGALARIDADTLLATLSGLGTDPDPTVREAQATALATLPDGRGLPRLRAMLEDKDARVLSSVLTALATARDPDAERVLTAQLTAQDVTVRAAAASGLGSLKATTAVPALTTAYRSTAEQSNHAARASALTAMAAISGVAARALLEEALADREWTLRVRAASLLGELGVKAQAVRPATGGRSGASNEWRMLAAPPFSPHAYLETARGEIEIELAIGDAPQTVANFMALARKGFFNGVVVHRVVSDFVVQAGDPRGDGNGGPGYTIRDEIGQRPYLRGTVGMALDGKDSGGSQFFITHSPQPHLDGRYTAFGQVVSGMDVVDRIEPGDVIQRVRIWDGVTPQ